MHKRLNHSLEDWYARYPSVEVRSEHAAMACLAGDLNVAKAKMDALGAKVDASIFEERGGRALLPQCKAMLESAEPPKRKA